MQKRTRTCNGLWWPNVWLTGWPWSWMGRLTVTGNCPGWERLTVTWVGTVDRDLGRNGLPWPGWERFTVTWVRTVDRDLGLGMVDRDLELGIWYFTWSGTDVPAEIYTHCKDNPIRIPFLGIAWPQSQFPHSCVCERFIYSQDRSTKSTYFLHAE